MLVEVMDEAIRTPGGFTRARRSAAPRAALLADAELDVADELYDEDEDTYVPRVRRRGLGKVVGALVATLVVVGLLLVHVWSRYGVIKLGYELSALSSERESLLEENRRLRIELRVLTRPDRLEPLARRQLGLARPSHDQILFVTADKLPLPSFPSLHAPAAAQEVAP